MASPQDSFHSCDSDSEPEEVGQAVSKTAALKQLEDERQAATAASERVKAKRRQEIERNTAQNRLKREKAELDAIVLGVIPDDLLATISAVRKGEIELESQEAEEEIEEDDEFPKNLSKPKKRKVTKSLTTPATRFRVLKVEEIAEAEAKARKDKKSCFNFRDQQLHNNKRVKRARSTQIGANKVKRSFA